MPTVLKLSWQMQHLGTWCGTVIRELFEPIAVCLKIEVLK
jgi:hypothetical protein